MMVECVCDVVCVWWWCVFHGGGDVCGDGGDCVCECGGVHVMVYVCIVVVVCGVW